MGDAGDPVDNGAARFLRRRLRRGDAAGARDRADPARARAAAEDARMLIRENEQLLHESGLFRFHQPKAFGGWSSVRGAGGHPGRARARLPVHRLERRQRRLPSLDPRLLRSRDPARGVGRQPGRADRLLDRARRRPRAQGAGRLHRQRPLAVLLGGRQFGLEHAGGHGLRRRRQDAGRLAAVPGAQVRLRDHRHLVRHGHGGDRQQGHRGQRAVRARAPGAGAPAPAAAAASIRRGAQPRPAVPHPDRGGLQPSAGAGGARRGRGRLRVVPRDHGQAGGHLYRRARRGFPGGADQGRPRALPDRWGATCCAQSAIAFHEPPPSATRCRTSRPSCGSARTRPSP